MFPGDCVIVHFHTHVEFTLLCCKEQHKGTIQRYCVGILAKAVKLDLVGRRYQYNLAFKENFVEILKKRKKKISWKSVPKVELTF